jgi:hypothetical protein
MTLQPMAKYSALLHALLFVTPLVCVCVFFLTIMFPLPISIYVHSSRLPFPLLFSIVFESHFQHSCFYGLHNFKNAHNF